MKQTIGCSTPAPRSSAAKQRLEQLIQRKKKKNQAMLIEMFVILKLLHSHVFSTQK